MSTDSVVIEPDTTLPRTYDYVLVTVAYRSRELVESMLSALPADIPTVVVDNSHGVDGLADALTGRPATRYLDGPGTGYAAAANLGASMAGHENIVFLNPDCTATVEQLDELVAGFARDPGLAATCTTTVLPDGTPELGVGGWEPSFPRALVHAIGAHKVFPTLGIWATPEPGRPIRVDWLGGACLAVRYSQFTALGGFDDSYFVYSEDVDFGRKVRAAGLRQSLRTDLVSSHKSGGSGDSKPTMLQLRSAMLVQYVRRHRSPASALGIRLALTAGMAARYLVCRARGRSVKAVDHSAYLRGLWVGSPVVGDRPDRG